MTEAPASHAATAAPAGAAAGAPVANGATRPAPTAPVVRTPDQIEAELDATRARLAGRIDALEDYVTPAHVLRRQVDRVRGVFVDEFGGIRPERVLVAVGVATVVLGVGAMLRRRRG